MRALLLLTLIAASPAAAQDEAAPAEELPSVIVMNLARGANVPEDVPKALTGLLTGALGREKRLRFVSGQELAQMMELEGEKARMGCDGDESCLSDIAGALGARFAVGGSITQLGELEVLQLRLLDVYRAESLSRVSRSARSVEEFVPLLDEMAAELLGPALARIDAERRAKEAKQAGDDTQPIDTHTVVDTGPDNVGDPPPRSDDHADSGGEAAATDDDGGSFLLSASLIGGGVALLGVAAIAAIGVTAVDIAMIALVNPSLGPEDAIAPAVYVGAAVIAAGGLALCLVPLFLGDEEEG